MRKKLSSDKMPESIVKEIGQDVLAQMAQVSEELQKELVSLSTQGVQVIAEKSGTYIQWDQPDLVIDAIREIVTQVCGKWTDLLRCAVIVGTNPLNVAWSNRDKRARSYLDKLTKLLYYIDIRYNEYRYTELRYSGIRYMGEVDDKR